MLLFQVKRCERANYNTLLPNNSNNNHKTDSFRQIVLRFRETKATGIFIEKSLLIELKGKRELLRILQEQPSLVKNHSVRLEEISSSTL